MSKFVRSGTVAALVACLGALMPSIAQAADECRNFGAVGSGLSESIATLMAKQGAINVAENRGWTVQGEAKLVSCTKAGIFGTECTARTYACKKPH